MNWEFVKKNRKAIQFLLVFAGVYFTLTTIYAFFIQHYYPTSDPFTRIASHQVVWFLSLFDSSVTAYPSQFNGYIAIANDRDNMFYIFEGCNGLKVLIVYLSFITAFVGPRRLFIWFAVIGTFSIHLINIGRCCLLYAVVFYFPARANFFYKYLFTIIIYSLVLVLWFFWIRKVRKVRNENV